MIIKLGGKEIDTNLLIKKIPHSHKENVDVTNIDISKSDINQPHYMAIKRDGVYVLLTGDATTLPKDGAVQLNVITKHTLKLAEVVHVAKSDYSTNHSKSAYGSGRFDNTKSTRPHGSINVRTPVRPRGASRGS